MWKLLKRNLLFLIMIIGQGCMSNNDKHIHELIEEIGIPYLEKQDSCFLVIIPGNGCISCIQGAVDNIREVKDTVYIFVGDSEKDFYLQSGGKKLSSFHNLYLDKSKVSVRLRMVSTFPMVYFLQQGKYVDSWPYSSP